MRSLEAKNWYQSLQCKCTQRILAKNEAEKDPKPRQSSQRSIDPPSFLSRLCEPFLTSKSPFSFMKLMTSVGMRYRILMSFFRKSRIFVLDTYILSVDMPPIWRERQTYIIHNGLIDEPDIRNPLLKVFERVVDIRAHSFDDETSVGSENVVQIFRIPHTGGAKSGDQVSTSLSGSAWHEGLRNKGTLPAKPLG